LCCYLFEDQYVLLIVYGPDVTGLFALEQPPLGALK
jgi:hypothetical protein